MKTRKWLNLFFFQNYFCKHILKTSTCSCFDAWLYLLVHIQFTPSEGPNNFVNLLLKKSDHGKKFHGLILCPSCDLENSS